jgi:hypothetical protein
MRIFGPKWEEVAGGWRRLHNEELRNLLTSSNILRLVKSRSMRWTGHVACIGGIKNAYIILVRKPEGERPPGRHKHRWEDNIKKDVMEIGWEDVNWMDLA